MPRAACRVPRAEGCACASPGGRRSHRCGRGCRPLRGSPAGPEVSVGPLGVRQAWGAPVRPSRPAPPARRPRPRARQPALPGKGGAEWGTDQSRWRRGGGDRRGPASRSAVVTAGARSGSPRLESRTGRGIGRCAGTTGHAVVGGPSCAQRTAGVAGSWEHDVRTLVLVKRSSVAVNGERPDRQPRSVRGGQSLAYGTMMVKHRPAFGRAAGVRDVAVRLPMVGGRGSLFLAVVTGVLLYEVFAQRRRG